MWENLRARRLVAVTISVFVLSSPSYLAAPLAGFVDDHPTACAANYDLLEDEYAAPRTVGHAFTQEFARVSSTQLEPRVLHDAHMIDRQKHHNFLQAMEFEPAEDLQEPDHSSREARAITVTQRAAYVTLALVAMLVGFAVLKYVIMLHEDKQRMEHGEVLVHWFEDRNMLLMVGFLVLVGWLGLGMCLFSQCIYFTDGGGTSGERHLTPVEAMYLCVQILTTVGYGDLTPSRPPGQIFIAAFIVFGIAIVASIVSQLFKAIFKEEDSAKERMVNRLLQTGLIANFYSYDTASPAESAGNMAVMEKMKATMTLLSSVLNFLIVMGVGVIFFCFFPGENKTIWQALYMSCVTFTTVGFGHYTPQTDVGRIFAVFWMLGGVLVTADLIINFGDWLMHRPKAQKALSRGTILLENMDKDGDGKVDKIEFLRFQLVRAGHIDEAAFDSVLQQFDQLDCERRGFLDISELHNLMNGNPTKSKAPCKGDAAGG